MARVLCLGAGMVGSLLAADLAGETGFEVTVADRSEASLQRAKRKAERRGATVRPVEADLSDARRIVELASDADVVVGALASALGFGALGAVIDAGKPYADISFMAEDALELDRAARDAGVPVVVDCGVAPGMSNLLAGLAARLLDPCERIAIYVGGLPKVRRKPFEYKAAFAPSDVIEEYTRPARLVVGGRVVTREALSEQELLDLPRVGTVEAFNTDGLRSLVRTLEVPDMVEKTLRYPGHAGLMRAFREAGLFGKAPVEIGGAKVRPLDVTSSLLFPKWSYEEGEADLTVMRVVGEGAKGGRRVRLIWDLYDELDAVHGDTSMARTTAFPAAILARMLGEGVITETGVLPLERLASIDAVVDGLFDGLASRGVRYERSETALEA